ncbi:unnamed protein product [Adineta steineri]|uniref:Uncharacterized protein n=3 Tax=Adineta steineri TaxID=433720 RepID=A0A818PP79_9BILA|nr:unnamed protein product [Adineta steineri]CAF3626523.1 unnamed protein product [Adineta steineri]
MDLLGLGSKVDIDFLLDPQGQRKQIEVKLDDNNTKRTLQYIYYDGEDVGGMVQIKLKKNSKVEHQGIRLEFIGQIEMLNDRSTVHEFINLSKLLAFPGELNESTSIDFHFPNVEKPYESYIGVNVKLRYFLRLTIIRRFTNTVSERDICVQQLSQYPEINNSIKMEVGIEDCLHIEFEYNKSKYHLKDVIVGKIYFLLVRIKIKHMEIAILKKESTGSGPNIYAETETVAKYEIMDGAPVRGESIPIRLFLGGYDLTPTMKDIQRKFSVRYFLNLVLVDEEERRYFKQQEIVLWRKQDKIKQKNSARQYAQFEPPNLAMKSEDSLAGLSGDENSPVNGPSSSVSEVDPSQLPDSSSTPLTRDFIGLCIGILSVVLVILIVAVCKWSRCQCLKRNQDHDSQSERLSSVIQSNASTSRTYSQEHLTQNQRLLSCNRSDEVSGYINNTRHDFLSPPQQTHNGHTRKEIKVPRVTITTLPVQPSQQLVPRLSTSPQVPSSTMPRNTYSIKQ